MCVIDDHKYSKKNVKRNRANKLSLGRETWKKIMGQETPNSHSFTET